MVHMPDMKIGYDQHSVATTAGWCSTMKLVCIFLVSFLILAVSSEDHSSELDYDSEFEDEIDFIHEQNEADEATSQISAWFKDGKDDFLEIEDEQEEDDEEFEYALMEEMQNDWEKRALVTRVANMLRKYASDYKLKPSNFKSGQCTTFRGSKHSTHTCSNKKTFLGEVKVCRVVCKSGYHLQKLIPHYELCGAPTEWRWTYELRGYRIAEEVCLKGQQSKKAPTSCTDRYCVATAAYYMNKIDFSVDPCDNFFDYSCGRWIKETPYPPTSRGRMMTYSILRKRVKIDMAKLLAAPITKSDIAAVKKTKIIYKSCMDINRINSLGAKPLLKILKGDLAWPVLEKSWKECDFDFASTYATLRGQYHNNIMFTVRVGQSFGRHVLQTWKGKTALPYQYYISSRYAARKAAYFSLMKDIAVMLGADEETAYNDMLEVLKFETQISLFKVLDIDFYSQKTLAQMNKDIPGVDWVKMFEKMIKSVPVSSTTLVEVWNENYLGDMIKLMSGTKKRVVQNYMVWRFVKHRIPNLDRRFEDRYLQYTKALYGTKALHKRWYKCSEYLIFAMKEPTGKMFVDSYFSPAKKATAEEMFSNIRKAFLYLLDNEVEWMDSGTKAYAKEKALAMVHHIGYNPAIYENKTYIDDAWKQLHAKRHDYFGNVLRVLYEISQNTFYKLSRDYDVYAPTSFTIRPTTVNAFYNPGQNSITLPAGEMQYPFYWGDKFPKVFQYGGIGTIIGHETTHGFDNHGALRDKYGNLKNWWSSSSWIQFHKRTTCMENQYSNYFWKAAGEYLNGKKTLGENIADNGGIRESYQGYKFYLQSHNMTGEDIEPSTGLTNDQMFFIGFANVRCAKYKKKGAENVIAKSVHSPGRFRVIGSLQNFDKFAQAFHCPSTSYMNPEKKCVIW